MIADASKGADELWNNASAFASEAYDKTVKSADEVTEWAKTAPDTFHELADKFNAEDMWNKIATSAAKVGQDLIIIVLSMYYTIKNAIQKTSRSHREWSR